MSKNKSDAIVCYYVPKNAPTAPRQESAVGVETKLRELNARPCAVFYRWEDKGENPLLFFSNILTYHSQNKSVKFIILDNASKFWASITDYLVYADVLGKMGVCLIDASNSTRRIKR